MLNTPDLSRYRYYTNVLNDLDYRKVGTDRLPLSLRVGMMKDTPGRPQWCGKGVILGPST